MLVVQICGLLLGTAFAAPAPPAWEAENRAIAHALGGLDGDVYTNSPRAFAHNYRKGFRVFEVDLIATREGRIMALHDWDKILEDRPFLHYWLGRIYRRFFYRCGPLSREEVKARKVYGKYTPPDLDEVLRLFAAKKDAYMVTDIKDDQFAGLSAIMSAASGDVMARVIPQIYHPDELKPVLALYPFRSVIFTLYRNELDDDAVVAFAAEHKDRIAAVTMHWRRFNPELARRLLDHGIRTYVHTLNNPQDVARFIAQGAWGVYTDFHPPDRVGPGK